METVYTLFFISVTILNSIELSSQAGHPTRFPSASNQPRKTRPSILQFRSYKRWLMPENAFVQVFAEHTRCLYRLEVNKEYLTLRSHGPGQREAFAVSFFGAGYAIYDEAGRQAAIMGDGYTRTLRPEEVKILDETIALFKLPAEGLPNVSHRALYGPPSRIPSSLQDKYYEDWILPLGFNIQVIQNHPGQSQRFYVVARNLPYDILRNPAGEVFAIRVIGQVHVLYNQQDREAAFNISSGVLRTLSHDETEFFYRRADTIRLIGSAGEIRRNIRS